MNAWEGQVALEVANELFPIESWKEILYIGVCPKTFRGWGGDFFLKYIEEHGAIFKCTIVEKYEPYAGDIQNTEAFKAFDLDVVCGDIVEYVKDCSKRFDIIIWWHGPEHVLFDDLEFVLREFEKMCDGLIIMGCPEGSDPCDDPESGDTHKIVLSMEHFEKWGYKAWLEDRGPKAPPSITAIKQAKDFNRGA